MIVKIAKYDGSKHSQWVFIDDVGEVATFDVWLRKVQREDDKSEVLRFFASEEGADEWKPDKTFIPPSVEKSVFSGELATLRIRVLLLTIRSHEGYSIAFHEAYLMNDEGKTIERL